MENCEDVSGDRIERMYKASKMLYDVAMMTEDIHKEMSDSLLRLSFMLLKGVEMEKYTEEEKADVESLEKEILGQ